MWHAHVKCFQRFLFSRFSCDRYIEFMAVSIMDPHDAPAPVPVWLQEFNDCENDCRPIQHLKGDGRKALWEVCKLLRVNSLGVAGQACRLLERYLSARHYAARSLLTNIEARKRFKQELASKLMVTMVTCVRLSAKMACSSMSLGAKIVVIYMALYGIQFSVSELNAVEQHVYETLDYSIPIFTSDTLVGHLAAEVNVPMHELADLSLVIDLAELRRDMLHKFVREHYNPTVSSSSEFSNNALRTLYLAAGTVAAVVRQRYSDEEAVKQLAGFTRAPPGYIECIADAIKLHCLPPDKDDESSDDNVSSLRNS